MFLDKLKVAPIYLKCFAEMAELDWRTWVGCSDVAVLFAMLGIEKPCCCGSCHTDANEYGFSLSNSEIEITGSEYVFDMCCSMLIEFDKLVA